MAIGGEHAAVREPWKHGDRSRRVIVSTWFGAEGCGEEIVEVFQMAPVLLECLIIMTFLKAIFSPFNKKTCVSDAKKKQHSNFFLMHLYDQQGLSVPSYGEL